MSMLGHVQTASFICSIVDNLGSLRVASDVINSVVSPTQFWSSCAPLAVNPGAKGLVRQSMWFHAYDTTKVPQSSVLNSGNAGPFCSLKFLNVRISVTVSSRDSHNPPETPHLRCM